MTRCIPFVARLVKALGPPERIEAFGLRCAVDEVVTVECESLKPAMLMPFAKLKHAQWLASCFLFSALGRSFWLVRRLGQHGTSKLLCGLGGTLPLQHLAGKR